MSSARTHPEHALPQEVRHFIERHLRSAAELELLLLLSRSPDTFWSPTAAASVVGAAEQDIRAHFGRFAAVGLLERGRQTDSFRFAPSSDEDRSAVAALARIYAERRNDVLHAIAGSISQIAAFSDAFRFPRR